MMTAKQTRLEADGSMYHREHITQMAHSGKWHRMVVARWQNEPPLSVCPLGTTSMHLCSHRTHEVTTSKSQEVTTSKS